MYNSLLSQICTSLNARLSNKYYANVSAEIDRTTKGGELLKMLHDGELVAAVNLDGYIFKASVSDNQKLITPLLTEFSDVKETFLTYEQAVNTGARSIAQTGYLCISEYDGVVLGIKKAERDGAFSFATWRKDGLADERILVTLGKYDFGSLKDAKRDFAVRSGLVCEYELFNEKEVATIDTALGFYIDGSKEYASLPFDDINEIKKLSQHIEQLLSSYAAEKLCPEVEETFDEEME